MVALDINSAVDPIPTVLLTPVRSTNPIDCVPIPGKSLLNEFLTTFRSKSSLYMSLGVILKSYY